MTDDTAQMVAWLRSVVEQRKATAENVHDLSCEAVPDPITNNCGPCDCGHPADVIADCEAKMALIDLHTVRSGTGGTWDTDPVAICNECSSVYPCDTLYLLAFGLRHREGWQDRWTP